MKKYKYLFYGMLNIIIAIVITVEYKDCIDFSLHQMILVSSYVVLINFLFLISYVDYKQKIIPNKCVLILFLIKLLLITIEVLCNKNQISYILVQHMLGAIVGGFIFLLPRFFVKGSVGMGDIKLVSVIGLYVGIDKIMTVILVSLFSSLIYFFIMFILKKYSKGKLVAFAPFITLSFIICTVLKL